MKMDRTAGSLLMTSSAPAMTSALAPPPMSRKLAGLPPTWLTTSTVDMARPAPFGDHAHRTVQPHVLQTPSMGRRLAFVTGLGLVKGHVILVAER